MNKIEGIAERTCVARGGLLALALVTLLAAGASAAPTIVATLESSFDTTKVEGSPARVFATDNFVFVLERSSHRIAVHDRTTGTNLFYYGAKDVSGGKHRSNANAGESYASSDDWAPGTGDGGFYFLREKPCGFALDIYSGANRFAVADTGNNRVQLFEFDPATGAITFTSSYGGAFKQPYAVAFMKNGDILVSDTGNRRVVRLNYGGGSWTELAVYAFGEQDVINGICYDDDGAEGFWVANIGVIGQRQRVSFHHTAGFSADPVVALGLPDTANAFSNPMDVQLWTVDDSTFIVVADNKGSRIRILRPNASGGYTHLSVVTDIGNYYDEATLGGQEDVWHPEGVFPVPGTNLVYVAVTGRNQVKCYTLAVGESGAEDFVPVRWPIDAITVSGGAAPQASIGWTVPASGLPSGGDDLMFRLDFRPSLTTGNWSESAIAPFAVDQSEAGTLHTESGIDLSGSPASGFFRLWWLNKVAE